MGKDNITYGPDNPHPLSARKTELIWEGKYDEFGNRREVDIAGCAMPMQKIETIDEPAGRLKAASVFLTMKKPTETTSVIDEYPGKGKYTACIKVVDIFGCDASITVEVEI